MISMSTCPVERELAVSSSLRVLLETGRFYHGRSQVETGMSPPISPVSVNSTFGAGNTARCRNY
jgi:hypothetical protein